MICKDYGECCECGETRMGIRVGHCKYICGPCHVAKWPISSAKLFSRAHYVTFEREHALGHRGKAA